MATIPKAGDPTPATTREQLLVQHREARARRNAAAPGGHAWEQASADVGRIEVEIARVERAMDPPLV
jgi:hypothetical protein